VNTQLSAAGLDMDDLATSTFAARIDQLERMLAAAEVRRAAALENRRGADKNHASMEGFTAPDPNAPLPRRAVGHRAAPRILAEQTRSVARPPRRRQDVRAEADGGGAASPQPRAKNSNIVQEEAGQPPYQRKRRYQHQG
jgi:hypothetical protein